MALPRKAIAKQLNLTLKQFVGLDELCSFIDADPRWVDRRHIAYLLATCYHETAHRFKPILEFGPPSYFNKYEPGTRIGRSLGNTQLGDGIRFKGAGYVQITGRRNFTLFSELLGKDLVGNPALVLDPATSYEIATRGMHEGLFTGKKLLDYLNDEKTDFVRARRIINGLDKAAEIAAIAVRIARAIEVGA